MIDLSTQINAIKSQYGEDAFRSTTCQAETAQLWGTPTCDYPEPTAAWANVETQAILMAALTGGRAISIIFTDDQGDPHALWQVFPF